jgi:uncharacterized protein (DUF1684 family)
VHLELLDWRRRVAELFAELRRRQADAETLAWFRAEKDALFREHPQTPLLPERRASFQGLAYWPYDADMRVVASFAAAPARGEAGTARPAGTAGTATAGTAGGAYTAGSASAAGTAGTAGATDARATAGTPDRAESEVAFSRVGTLRFELKGQALELGAHWIEGYAGGLFVPFRDTTCGSETYGGGRYLLDTIKSADLGSDLAAGTVVLDFNYAYHPSCAYDPRWPCPLAPPENRLGIPIRCGERL